MEGLNDFVGEQTRVVSRSDELANAWNTFFQADRELHAARLERGSAQDAIEAACERTSKAEAIWVDASKRLASVIGPSPIESKQSVIAENRKFLDMKPSRY